MLPLMRWRYSVSDGSPMPNWIFRVFDYLGLGCILISPAEFIVRPKIWQVWVGTLIGGCVFLWFGEKFPKLKVKLLERWRAPKYLDAALEENATLRLQLDQALQTISDSKNKALEIADSDSTSKPSDLNIIKAEYRAFAEGGQKPDVTPY
jgi:hypothetical protein